VAAMILNDLVDRETGELKRPAQPRDVLPPTKAAVECFRLLHGLPQPAFGPAPDLYASIQQVLEHVDDDARITILRGLRAIAEHQQRVGERG
jgi:hypothetical protein